MNKTTKGSGAVLHQALLLCNTFVTRVLVK